MSQDSNNSKNLEFMKKLYELCTKHKISIDESIVYDKGLFLGNLFLNVKEEECILTTENNTVIEELEVNKS